MLSQLEIFAQNVFLASLPAISSLFAAIGAAAKVYPIAAVIFISVLPVVLSIDYVTIKGNEASFKKATADGIFASRIASIIECRPAIRTCDAGNWTKAGAEDLLKDVKHTHSQNIFLAIMVAAVTLLETCFLGILLLVPAFLSVLRERLEYPIFQFLFLQVVSWMKLECFSVFNSFNSQSRVFTLYFFIVDYAVDYDGHFGEASGQFFVLRWYNADDQ